LDVEIECCDSAGTMTDDEMLKMPIPSLQESGGLIFVWVTGRALELGRDCMRTWGYASFTTGVLFIYFI
jgi:N6-adenosine-specific RNA methylase IME4